jgi:hypothetical protein
VACGDDDFKPSPTPTPTVTPAHPPGFGKLEAPASMTAVGDKVKLPLTAFYTDGTSRDIAAEATWTVDLPSVVSITSGEATALSLGATFVQARYLNRFYASVKVQVTPAGTFAIVGGTREPGNSGLPGVSVFHPASGLSTVSNSSGNFTLGGLVDRTVLLQKSGYEDATYVVAPDDYQWLGIQRQIRVQAGSSVSVRIAPHDMDYTPAYASVAGEQCGPCKLIRLTNDPGTRVRVTLKWTPIAVVLRLWNDDGTFVAPSTSAGFLERDISSDKTEVWLYIGQLPASANRTYVDVQVTVTRVGL